ncbi:MAG: 16S rRNA (adenine(1518)-N(6)/adenine(1519)-N(6))-dimethyltransferase RsmA [Lachnospiraceae bacterium]|nr:16S rRNA (adenine(1518)-N(6)/adenine(1519)-N(6))-dimethyltransferase RsmA [Lachnospiraceae bacterium]
MPDLSNPTETLALLHKYNITTRKRYGQNFLINRHSLDKILNIAAIDENDCVLEIGPGIGTLTRELAKRAAKVIAVEIDCSLIPVLQETLAEYDNVVVINEDILKASLTDMVNTHRSDNNLKIVANLPYYITTPFIMMILESGISFSTMTVMVQKEVAARITSTPGSKSYGALSLAVQYHAAQHIVATVSPTCFIPRPKVDSAIVHMVKHSTPPVSTTSEEKLFTIIRAAFNQRRKTLVNALAGGAPTLKREAIIEALQTMYLDESIRGEALTLPQFAELTTLLYPNIE